MTNRLLFFASFLVLSGIAAAQEARPKCASSVSNTIRYGETWDCTGTAAGQTWEFDAVAGEVVSFHLTRVAGTGLPCLVVENAPAVVLVTRICDTVINIPGGVRQAMAVPSSGRYRILITESGTTFQTVQYFLSLERVAPPTATAPLLLPNIAVTESINPSGDRDLYRFRVEAGDEFAFILNRTAGAGSPILLMLDTLGAPRQIASGQVLKASTSGTFGLWVADQGDNNVYNYSLVLGCRGICPRPPPNVENVLNAANFKAGVCSGAFVSVFGTFFSTVDGPWLPADFIGTKMPTTLEGVSVTFGGRRASVAYVSQGQINLIVPNLAAGTVPVKVITTAGESAPFNVRLDDACPAAFQLEDQRYAIGVLSDGLFARTPAFAPPRSRNARVGDIISIYPTGLGQTNPAYPDGEVLPPILFPTVTPAKVFVGGVQADVQYSGLIGPGLYQINLRIPQVAAGEQALRIEVGDFKSPEQVSLLIGQ